MKTRDIHITMCFIIIILLICLFWQFRHYEVKAGEQQIKIYELQKERNHCCLGFEDCKRELRWEGVLGQILNESALADLDVLSWRLEMKEKESGTQH